MGKVLYVNQSKLVSGRSIPITGYRHASNLILAATILAPKSLIAIANLPDLVDTDVMLDILKWLGGKVTRTAKNSVLIDTSLLRERDLAAQPLTADIHGSLYLIPALLARFGRVSFGRSGGCQIGSSDDSGGRPISHITDVMEAFGATVEFSDLGVKASADSVKRTTLDIASFSDSKDRISGPLTSGATKAAILLALAVTEGKTIIKNPFLKSETINLLEYVSNLGFSVFYDKDKIEIEYGYIKEQVTHHIISDPSEIITYVSLAVYHNISLQLTGITAKQTVSILAPELTLLEKLGVNLHVVGSSIFVKRSTKIRGADIEITPEGVCTDHHPFLLAILLMADRVSTITEYVWLERFQYIPELRKMQIDIERKNNKAWVKPQKPKEAVKVVHGMDLRASALLLIIALKSPGETQIVEFSHLYRGYEDMFEKLSLLGGIVEVREVVDSDIGAAYAE